MAIKIMPAFSVQLLFTLLQKGYYTFPELDFKYL